MKRVAAASALVAILLVGCSGGNATDSDAVSVMVAGDPEEIQAFRDVAKAYEENGGGDVELIEVADRDEMIAKLSTSIAGGSAPDAFVMNYRNVGQFQAKDALAPVSTYLATSGALAESDFYDAALDAFRFDGDLACMPTNISSLVVYYNEDLFREAAVALPEAGWTWADMVDSASALTSGEQPDTVYGLGVDPEIIRVAPFIWSAGGQVVDSETDPTTFTLSQPSSREAMQSFFNLRSLYGVVPTDLEVESEDLESRFLNGRLAMYMDSRKVVPGFRTITDFDWDVAPLPILRDPATILHSDAYCMTAASDRLDETWDFVEFAVGEEGQRIAAATGRIVPSLKSVASTEAFLEPGTEPENAQVFLDNIPLIRRVPHISTWPEIEDTANQQIEEGFYTDGEAAEVAAAVESSTAHLFEQAGEG